MDSSLREVVSVHQLPDLSRFPFFFFKFLDSNALILPKLSSFEEKLEKSYNREICGLYVTIRSCGYSNCAEFLLKHDGITIYTDDLPKMLITPIIKQG